jgi:hypothetical protein
MADSLCVDVPVSEIREAEDPTRILVEVRRSLIWLKRTLNKGGR